MNTFALPEAPPPLISCLFIVNEPLPAPASRVKLVDETIETLTLYDPAGRTVGTSFPCPKV